MGDKTKIEWTDATWNPITGCRPVSWRSNSCTPATRPSTRLAHTPSRAGLTTMSKSGPVWNGKVRFNEKMLTDPLRWKRPRMIFVCAHGDLFAEGVPDEWIDRVFAVMALAPQHVFQVLTKRPARMLSYICGRPAHNSDSAERIGYEIMSMVDDHPNYPARWPIAGTALIHGPTPKIPSVAYPRPDIWPLPNLWLGVSVEDQRRADERIPILLETPAAVRWISAEPLLGPLDLTKFFHTPIDMARGLDWVVVGGESGRGARPMNPAWARSIRDQCNAAGAAAKRLSWR